MEDRTDAGIKEKAKEIMYYRRETMDGAGQRAQGAG